MTSSIILTLLFSLYNCFKHCIILYIFSFISFWISITKKQIHFIIYHFRFNYILPLTAFWTHIESYDNIRYGSIVLFRICPYHLLLKSYISFLLVRCTSINFAKYVKLFCNFQNLKTFAPKANSFDNFT